MSEEEDIARAKSRGWKDKDVYVESGGDPEKWRPAEEFLKIADDHNGMLRENLKRVEDTLTRIQKERETDKQVFDEFRKFSESATKKAEERAYNEAKRDYDRQVSEMRKDLKDAVKNGDEGAVDTITTKIDTLKKPEPPKIEERQSVSPDLNPEFVKFKESNTWYMEDPAMSAYADSMGAFVQRTKPHVVGTPAFFDEVLKLVKKEYPDIFAYNGKKRSSAVEGSGTGDGGGHKGGKRTWADLPDDAKAAYNNFKRIMPKYTKEEYIQNYFVEE